MSAHVESAATTRGVGRGGARRRVSLVLTAAVLIPAIAGAVVVGATGPAISAVAPAALGVTTASSQVTAADVHHDGGRGGDHGGGHGGGR